MKLTHTTLLPGLRAALLGGLLMAAAPAALAQTGVTIGAATAPDVSAALDIVSSTKGALLPRLTAAQVAAIATPATGLLVFQTDGAAGFYYNGGTPVAPAWQALAAASTNGYNSVVKTTAVAANMGCFPSGGFKFEAGLDMNRNGTLDAGEEDATLTRTVCNGYPGPPGQGYGGSSTSSNTIGLGLKTFAFQFSAGSQLAYVAGQRVRVANSGSDYMEGTLTYFYPNAFEVNVDRAVGSGTFTFWTIGVAGDVGATGPAGADATVAAGPGLSSTVSGGVTTVQLGGAALTAATDVPLAGNNLTFSGTTGTVGIGTSAPEASAKLDVTSTTQGLLPPRLSAAQRDAIASPATGLLVFQTDGTQGIYYYTGLAWVNLTNGRVPDATGSTVPANGALVSTLAGTAGSAGSANGTGAATRFNYPADVAVDGAGNVYVADGSNHTIRKITAAGVVSTLAGTAGSSGSADGLGATARFNYPTGMAVDAAGTVYVADKDNGTIRKITAVGEVSTLAGTAGSMGSADGAGAVARFRFPSGVAVDAAGTVYVADTDNSIIRKITAAGVVSTLAGTAGSRGSADGTGAAARFYYPTGVAVDPAGTVYVADQGNHTIRRITAAGVVSTLAGTAGSTGSADGTGAAARFNNPAGVAVDAGGAVYVADYNHTIRKITVGVVSTLAGTAGSTGSADGRGAAARFNFPYGVAVDATGTVYVADQNNHTIRVLR